ncbi:uncharacterized protein LOC143372416 [Andrena cerasifolii]|uniref:uncharacterized protein LOC143372416 n=1 Tax=Andrena cerasifolii TaxID=2819439 RepID=UPI0040376B43
MLQTGEYATVPTATEHQDSEHVKVVTAAPIRVPTFWPQKVSLWFRQLEAQFVIARITKDETKFGYVVAQLDGKYAEEVEDIICNPPDTKKYEAIKTELIKRLSDSDTTRVRKLLETEEIGDRTPTQFWRHLKELAGSAVKEDFLTEMWKSRLPSKTQLVLAATSDKDGAKLAEIADRIHEIPGERGKIASTSHTSEMDLLREELRQMRLQLNAVVNGQRRPRGRLQSKNRRGKRSPSNNRQQQDNMPRDLCWYHYNFADKAAKCVSPCKWTGPKPENQ